MSITIDLSNQVAMVTGGSRGIGAACAVLLAEAGADIIVVYGRNSSAAERVLKKIDKLGRKGLVIQCRVERLADCKRVVDRGLAQFGRIDILINGAGIWQEGAVESVSPQEWNRMVSINLTGTFLMSRAVLPVMKKQNYGRIINISSTAGQRGEAFHSHYAASKGGVIAFTKSMAVEAIRDGIWVNCVAPGWVDTDMVSHVMGNPTEKRSILRTIPRKKIATADEIAGSVLFLASPLSNNVVGEILNVNGGSVLCG